MVVLAISRFHAAEMFQSSTTSWSSKIMALGTAENSQRIMGSPQDFAVQAGVFLKVGHLLARWLAGGAARAYELPGLG